MLDIDIFRTAGILIKKYGKTGDPSEYAVKRMCEFYEKGDIEAAIIWARINNAIEDIYNKNLGFGATIH